MDGLQFEHKCILILEKNAATKPVAKELLKDMSDLYPTTVRFQDLGPDRPDPALNLAGGKFNEYDIQ